MKVTETRRKWPMFSLVFSLRMPAAITTSGFTSESLRVMCACVPVRKTRALPPRAPAAAAAVSQSLMEWPPSTLAEGKTRALSQRITARRMQQLMCASCTVFGPHCSPMALENRPDAPLPPPPPPPPPLLVTASVQPRFSFRLWHREHLLTPPGHLVPSARHGFLHPRRQRGGLQGHRAHDHGEERGARVHVQLRCMYHTRAAVTSLPRFHRQGDVVIIRSQTCCCVRCGSTFVSMHFLCV